MPNAKRIKTRLLILLLLPLSLHSQPIAPEGVNTAVGEAEVLQYDLYYNWKFLWVKAGSASMSVTRTFYEGEPAFRTRLLTRGSDRADRFFVLRDTLTSLVTSVDMLPRLYTKTDMEGEKYRQRFVRYSYSGKQSVAEQHYINPYGVSKWQTDRRDSVIYDMLSFLLRARSFDPSGWEEGRAIRFLMTDGGGVEEQTLIFRGRKTVNMHNNDARYNCLVLSFVEYDKKGKDHDIATFYVTDDLNHIPVRVDFFLSFGSSKAYLSGYTGLRNEMTARVK